MRRLLIAVCALSAVACGGASTFHPATPQETAAGSPLGPSYILVPLPNDDDSLLGRVLLDVPENGRSLEEVSRPNECADKLTSKKEGPIASTFEDGQELAAGGKARAALGVFGFEGDAQTATHFYYKLDVNKRVAQTDTTEYIQCCKDKGTCGYGFVSALIYGDGQYATASETSAEGGINIPVAGGAGGFVKARVLHKRNVHGYVAALVTITDQAKSKSINVLGDPAAAGIVLTEENLPDQVKARFYAQRIQVLDRATTIPWYTPGQRPLPVGYGYVFGDGNGEVTENEFIRRYAALTGDTSLDSAEHNRRSGWLIGGAILGAVSVPTLVVSALNLSSKCSPTDYTFYTAGDLTSDSTCKNGVYNTAGQFPSGWVPLPGHPNDYYDPNETKANGLAVGMLGVGIAGTALAVGMVIYGLAAHDGDADEHVITKPDADLYVAKYNRALLRKTVDETKERMQGLSGKNASPSFQVMPVLSPEFTGIVGRF